MRLTRRGLLALAGGALAIPVLSSCDDDERDGSTGRQQPSAAKAPARFTVPLPVPPVLEPASTGGGTDRYDLTQRAATVELLPGLKTEIWGYNGRFPGPTIVSRSGRTTVVRHHNELPVPVAVHLHGGKTPPESDGYPTDLVLPTGGWTGAHVHSDNTRTGTAEYTYPLDQPAATLWYHDHRMDFTGPQVYRGLAGFHLVHDDDELALPLPKGERDIPLMICDRSFNEDGSFSYPSIDPSLRSTPGVTRQFMQGVLGDVILVNGAPWPVLEVTNTRYRFRLLNASNARRYLLALEPGGPFTQIGSDSGLLARPQQLDEVQIAGAERFDVVVDFSRYPVGSAVTLVNRLSTGPTGEVMRFQVVRRATDDSAIPSTLVDVERLDRASATTTRRFRFTPDGNGGMRINDERFDPDRDAAQPQLGATELWRLNGGLNHPIHLHLAHFQVLSRNGQAPRPSDAGWKDTVDLRSGEQVDVLARFTGYRGRYVFHCHNLEHEDMGMMANLRVV